MFDSISKTQMTNIVTLASILVMILPRLGLTLTGDQVIFLLSAGFALASTGFNYFNRFKRGDLTLGGFRK